MDDRKWYLQMLYISVGLMVATISILSVLIIPPTHIPDIAIIPFRVNIGFQAAILVALITVLGVHRRLNDISRMILAITGVLAIILGLMLLDASFAYLGQPDKPGVSIRLFFVVGFDIIVGVLIMRARYLMKTFVRKQIIQAS